MPETLLSTGCNSSLLQELSVHLCQIIITVQEQQPELLVEKYRNVAWQSNRNQSRLIEKIIEVLARTQDEDEQVEHIQKLLKTLFVPQAFHSSLLNSFLEKFCQFIFVKLEVNPLESKQNLKFSGASLDTSPKKSIAVLLLDAENLQITTETEKFLTTVCTYPIQIKIAFSNWCNRGKLDVELHARNYDLIHVPIGKDNADGKMITFGSAIHERFPNTKEVFVCSSDKVMTNLCNLLEQKGLTVYHVSQQGDNITILNRKNGTNLVYSPQFHTKISSIDKFLNTLKELIKEEQKRTSSSWVSYNIICQNFKEKYKISINQVVSTYFVDKIAKDIFTDYPQLFSLHQIPEEKKFYITLFEAPEEPTQACENSSNINIVSDRASDSINSIAELERSMITILKKLLNQSQENYINHGILGSELHKYYGEGISKILKRLQFDGTFTKFLESCKSVKVDKTEKSYRVRLV